MRKRWGLLDFILVLGVVASVIGLYSAKTQTKQLHENVIALKRTAGELVVDDTTSYWVLERRAIRPDRIYDVYVPEGKKHFLAVATTGIFQSTDNFPEPLKQIPIPSGQHEIRFITYKRKDGASMHVVTLDETTSFEFEKTSFRGRGVAGGIGYYFSPTSFPSKAGACHLHSSIMYPKDNEEFRDVQLGKLSTAGVCVWIKSE